MLLRRLRGDTGERVISVYERFLGESRFQKAFLVVSKRVFFSQFTNHLKFFAIFLHQSREKIAKNSGNREVGKQIEKTQKIATFS